MKNENIKLVVTDAGPSRLLQKHSPARMHLADLINRKLSIESTLRHLVEAGDKLREAADAERHAAAALTALDAEEASIMSTWAAGPGGWRSTWTGRSGSGSGKSSARPSRRRPQRNRCGR